MRGSWREIGIFFGRFWLGSKNSSTLAATQLRPYQLECIENSLSRLTDGGVRRQAVSLPTGSGKTVIFSELLARIPSNGKSTKSLVLSHREELLEQAYNQCVITNPDRKVTMDKAAVKPDLNADIIVASVQTLGRSRGWGETNHASESYDGTKGHKPSSLSDPKSISPRLSLYDPKLFKAIIIDEAHHATSDAYKRIVGYFEAHNPNIFIWGCSATLRRYDGLALDSVFDEITFHKDIGEMMDAGYLCNMKLTAVSTTVAWGSDWENLVKSNKDAHAEKLKEPLSYGEIRHVNNVVRNQIVVDTYRQVAIPDGRRSTIVFSSDIKHAEALVERFRANNIDTRCIHGNTKPFERSAIIDDFRVGTLPLLVNCSILTEGSDFPKVDCILLAKPTKSAGLLLQMIGRGLRIHEGKKDCLVLDFVDCTSGLSPVAPTLLGLHPKFDIQGLDIAEVSRRLRPIIKERPEILDRARSVSAAEAMFKKFIADQQSDINVNLNEMSNPFATSTEDRDSNFIRRFSKRCWIRVGPQKLVLQFPTFDGTRGELTIEGIKVSNNPDPNTSAGTESRKNNAACKAKSRGSKSQQKKKL